MAKKIVVLEGSPRKGEIQTCYQMLLSKVQRKWEMT